MNSRVDAYMRGSMKLPHVRDIEVSELLDRNHEILDVVHLCAHKVSLVSGNKNATLTIIQDMMWATLSTLWDQNLLTRKHDLIRLIEESGVSSDENSELRFQIAAKEKQLKSALEGMKHLQEQVRKQPTCSGKPITVGVWDVDAVVEPVIMKVDRDVEAEVMCAEERLWEIVSHESVAIDSPDAGLDLDKLLCELQAVKTELDDSKASKTEVLQRTHSMMTEDTHVALMHARSMMTEDAVDARVSTADTRGAPESSQTEFELNRETFEDFRVNQLLFEITVKDEIIETLSAELGHISSRRSSQASGHVLGCSPSLVPAVLAERLDEISRLRSENDELRKLLKDLEQDKALLESHLSMTDSYQAIIVAPRRSAFYDELNDTGRISVRSQSLFHPDLTDSPSQTDAIVSILSSRSFQHVVIPSISTEVDLLAELETEKLKSTKALEESRRAKVCLDELERQLVSLQFQLRRAGVQQEHIHHAMKRSGLGELMRGGHAAVFERLYRDALDRMQRLEKIRKQAHEIQAQQLVKRNQSSPGFPILVQQHPVHAEALHALAKPAQQRGMVRHAFGGGFMAGWLSRPQRNASYQRGNSLDTCLTGTVVRVQQRNRV